MTVLELIEELKKHPDDLKVFMEVEGGFVVEDIELVHRPITGRLKVDGTELYLSAYGVR